MTKKGFPLNKGVSCQFSHHPIPVTVFHAHQPHHQAAAKASATCVVNPGLSGLASSSLKRLVEDDG